MAATKIGFHSPSPISYEAVGSVNQHVGLFNVKENVLKAAGWTIPISGDGLSAYADDGSDVITHGGSGAGGLDNPGAYFVAQRPDGNDEILFSRAGSTTWLFHVSQTGFSGGDATTLPTAGDTEVLATAGFPGLFGTSAFLFAAADDVDPYGFYVVTFQSSICDGVFAYVPCLQPPDSTDSHPYVYVVNTTTPTLSFEIVAEADTPPDTALPVGRSPKASPLFSFENFPMTLNAVDSGGGLNRAFPGEAGDGQLETSALAPFVPGTHMIWDAVTDRNAVKGLNTLMLWTGQQRLTHFVERDYWSWNGITLLATEDIALIWPGGTANFDTDRGDAYVYGVDTEAAAPPDTTPPTISNISPAPGTTITQETTISFDIVDESGEFGGIVVFVSYPNGAAEIVHDGDAFRGAFDGSPNSRETIANGFRYTIRPVGGWRRTPTIEYVPIDKGGNIGVIA